MGPNLVHNHGLNQAIVLCLWMLQIKACSKIISIASSKKWSLEWYLDPPARSERP
jgi:hypothetical protein